MIITTTARVRTAVGFASDDAEADLCLTAGERADHDRLPDHRRGDWRAGRLAAKRAVAAILGIEDLTAVEISSAPGTAPRVRACDDNYAAAAAALRLSISHRDERAVAAAMSADVGCAGVDIERRNAVSIGTTRYFLTAAERRGLDSRGATELWALKEAAWKALALEVALPFTDVELGLDREGQLETVTARGVARPAHARIMYPSPDYVVAMVWAEEVS